MTMAPNHYDVLGIPTTASPALIKAAYRKAAARAHPDREGGNEERFKAIQAAHDCLLDPERRRIYDAVGPDATAEQIKAEAAAVVRGLFLGRIGSGEHAGVIAAVQMGLSENARTGRASIAAGTMALGKLQRAATRFKRITEGENILREALDALIAEKKISLLELERAQLVTSAAVLLLREYHEEELDPFEESPDWGPAFAERLLHGRPA